MRVTKILLPLVILALAGGTFAYFRATKEAPRPLARVDRAPVVSVQRVEHVSATPSVRVFGRVESSSVSVLRSGLEADVVKVHVLEGNAVVSGQLLMELDDADVQLEILQREAELAEIEALRESDRVKLEADTEALATERALLRLTRKAVERAETLAKSQAGSQATLDEALLSEQRQRLAITQRKRQIDDFESRQGQLVARQDRALAALNRAQRDLSRTRVVAPFTGRILDVTASQGDRVNRGGELLRLFDETRLEIRAQIPSSHIPTLQASLDAGQQVVAAAVYNGSSIALTLHRLTADVKAGQGGVDAFFRADDEALPPLGMTLEIRLALPTLDGVVVISPDALYGPDRVYRVVDELLESVTVRRVGEFTVDDGSQRIILDGAGLSPGDAVINSRVPQAVSGLKVSIAE